MNTLFFTAGILCFLLGIIHSILGEVLIFKNLREDGAIVPSKQNPDLKSRHIHILWGTWHLATIFGIFIGILLLKISKLQDALSNNFIETILSTISFTMFGGAFLILFATKGKHPGWVVLLLIALLIQFS